MDVTLQQSMHFNSHNLNTTNRSVYSYNCYFYVNTANTRGKSYRKSTNKSKYAAAFTLDSILCQPLSKVNLRFFFFVLHCATYSWKSSSAVWVSSPWVYVFLHTSLIDEKCYRMKFSRCENEIRMMSVFRTHQQICSSHFVLQSRKKYPKEENAWKNGCLLEHRVENTFCKIFLLCFGQATSWGTSYFLNNQKIWNLPPMGQVWNSKLQSIARVCFLS